MNKFLVSLLTVAAVLFTGGCGRQEAPAGKVTSRTGYVKIFSKTAMEDILAETNTAVAIFEPQTGHLRVRIVITTFVFPNHLMQEHFNENYVESDKFPKATFKGKVETGKDISLSTDHEQTLKVSGTLTIHGVSHEISIPATVTVKNGVISATATFKILLADYKIKIPAIASEHINNEISIVVAVPVFTVFKTH